MATTFTNEKP